LDWLEAHGEDSDSPPGEIEAEHEEGDYTVPVSGAGEAKSLACLECGKVFKNHASASWHGEKSGHSQFEESTEEVKPLTEEEKALRLAELRAKMDAKRKAKAVQDADDVKRNEAIRRKGGKDMGTIREELKLKEAEKEAAQRKKDKIEDAKAKARVKEQIEADKKARAEKAAAEKARREGRPVTMAPVGLSATQSAAVARLAVTSPRNYAETRLQLRLPSGSPIVTTQKSEAKLSEVATWLIAQPSAVEAGLNSANIKFSTTFPRKVFSIAELNNTLAELGLSPSAVLVVTS